MKTVLAVLHHPVFGGPHNQLVRLSKPLAARGWTTIAVLPEEQGNAAERLRSAGIKVVRTPLHRPRKCLNPGPHLALMSGLFREIAGLRGIIREQRADLVQVFGPLYPHGALAAHLEGVPLVWQLLGTFAPYPIRLAMMPAILGLSDVVMTTGLSIARQHPGVRKLKHRWVPFYPPVDTEEFRPDPSRRALAREELGIPAEGILVGTVGNFNRVKGHDFFVHAASYVQARFPMAFFRILGAHTPTQASYYDAKVRRVAERLGLLRSDRMRFVEPGGRVAELLPAFDLFVMTSRAEGVPTSIVEAMACGIPVVAADVGAVREVVKHGVTGIVVPGRDARAAAGAIADLVVDPSRRLAMGAAGRMQAMKHFHTSICVETHLTAYQLACRRRGVPRSHVEPVGDSRTLVQTEP